MWLSPSGPGLLVYWVGVMCFWAERILVQNISKAPGGGGPHHSGEWAEVYGPMEPHSGDQSDGRLRTWGGWWGEMKKAGN